MINLTPLKGEKIQWKRDNWNYIGDNVKKIKKIMKKSVALHFARTISVNQNKNTKLFSIFEKEKVIENFIEMIPGT